MFSLWTSSLPRCPHCPASTTDTHSEFDSMPKTFASYTRNQCSTACPVSAEVCLRAVSRGTSYYRSRLVFRPYTQVIQTICTSVLVRASTLLPKGFTLPRHRSTGFGYPTIDSRRAHLAPRLRCGLSVSLRLRTCVLNLANNRNSTDQFSNRTV